MLANESSQVVLTGECRQGFCGDFGRRQLQINRIGGPRAPVESAITTAPFFLVLGANETANPIERQITTRCTFPRNFDLGCDVLILVMDGIRRTMNAAGAIVQVQVPSNFGRITNAFALEEIVTIRTLIGHGASRA